MENDTYLEPTIFDTLTQSREIQMLKTAVPFMKQAQKRQFAILIKYMELQRAIQVFSPGSASLSACELPAEENNGLNMLNAMRKYASPREQEMIDNLTNLFSMMTLYSEVM
ncbi:MAG: hypothetical protein IJZ23_05870 [Roseburia sp.]|nr:hypothetical protein [Roseburia sp.]